MLGPKHKKKDLVFLMEKHYQKKETTIKFKHQNLFKIGI